MFSLAIEIVAFSSFAPIFFTSLFPFIMRPERIVFLVAGNLTTIQFNFFSISSWTTISTFSTKSPLFFLSFVAKPWKISLFFISYSYFPELLEGSIYLFCSFSSSALSPSSSSSFNLDYPCLTGGTPPDLKLKMLDPELPNRLPLLGLSPSPDFSESWLFLEKIFVLLEEKRPSPWLPEFKFENSPAPFELEKRPELNSPPVGLLSSAFGF